MIKKGFLIIGLYYFLILVQSCCGSQEYEYYNLNGFSISNIDKHSLTLQNDSSTISLDNFSVSMDFTTKKYASLLRDFKIINSANASDCDDELLYEIKNRIVQVTIKSNADFNISHPAGTALNEYFIPYRVIKTCMANGGSFDSGCAENQFDFFGSLEDVLNKSFTQTSYIDLSNSYEEIDMLDLTTKPDYSGYMKFYVDLEFEDGSLLTDSTRLIRIE